MKGAQASIFLAPFYQLDTPTNQIDKSYTVVQFGEEGLRDSHVAEALSAQPDFHVPCRLGKIHAPPVTFLQYAHNTTHVL